MGQAYAFFKCRADQQNIIQKIPDIRRLARIPPQADLKLALLKELRGDDEIVSIAKQALGEGLNYSITLRYPEKDNFEAAKELKVFMTQMYQSTLYVKGEPFQGGIGYKEGEHYAELD